MSIKFGSVNLSQRDPVVKKKRKKTWAEKTRLRTEKRLVAVMKTKYGLDAAAYARLSKYQLNRCAICDRQPRINLTIDHDHKTGKVRGLLCMKCNISKVGSNTTQSIHAVERYLTNPPADRVFVD